MTRTFNHALALVAALFITSLTFAEAVLVPVKAQDMGQMIGSNPIA